MQRIANLWKTTGGKIIITVASLLIFCVFFICVIAVISPSTTAEPTSTLDVDDLETAAAVTASAEASLNAPSETSEPTNTPRPTNTPEPTATSTPQPEPINLTGSGDSIVDVPKGDYPAIMRAKHSGGGNFIVSSYDANNNQIDLLINTIGAYEGIKPLDFLTGEQTARLEIKAGGPWEITILPVQEARTVTIPGPVNGTGDDVFYIEGGAPDTIIADASQMTSNFIVYSYSDDGQELVFNEIGPYTGTALLDSSTFMLSVQAEGNWSVEITTR